MSRERVDELISRVCREHLGKTKADQAKYYEEVHQELAPLARGLEKDIQDLKATADLVWKERIRLIENQKKFYQQQLDIVFDPKIPAGQRLQMVAELLQAKLPGELKRSTKVLLNIDLAESQ